MFQRINCTRLKVLSAFALALQLIGCGGGGGDVTTAAETVISGSVGDGPVVGATLNFYDKAGNLIRTVTSDNRAKYAAKIKAKGNAYPLTVEVEGGTDLVTGLAPDFRMTSCIAHPSSKTININPFTTMIVETARTMPGGLGEENIAAAEAIIEDKMNFGLDPRVIDSPITTRIDDSNIAVMAKSSEAMGEMIRRTRDRLMDLGVVDSEDAVVSALADDIADGELDGRGGRKANIRVATVSRLVSAQVVIEALSNELKVGGVIATDRMDDAIVTTHPSLRDSAMTDNVPVNAELLVQGRNNIRVAQNLAPSADLDSIAAILDSLRAGSLPSEVELVLPAGSSETMDQPVSIAIAATDEQLDAAINGGGSDNPPESPTEPPPANNAPVLSGAPDTTVLQDATYRYQPSATDADADTLIFSILNRPGWARFDTTTGRLSGTPTNAHVGTYSNIVVTVSDGSLSDSVGPFSITVTNTNDAPTITGSAPTNAAAGGLYSFQPSANDPDSDDLMFSIANPPSWASFDTNTGRLSGTPASGDAGSYDGIVISVSDGTVSRSLPAFAITVTTNLPANRAPVISGIPASRVAEDSSYIFQPSASDPDGDNLSFRISNRPAWARFNSTTGRLTGTPKNAHVGSYRNIRVTVSDGTSTASIGPFSITVTNANDAPVISGTPARSVAEDSTYLFQPSTSDPDGDSLTFRISNRPGWASFNRTTGRLTGTPNNADVGSYGNIRITVSDGSASASVGPFSITVTNINDTPVISGTPVSSVDEGSTYNFEPTASDPDGDNLTFSIQNRPLWASFNSSTGRLTGTPASGDAAVYSDIRISVSDGAATVHLAPFSVAVNSSGPQTGSATLSWVAPVARANGTALALSEIEGYTLYYGESAGDYPNSLPIKDGSLTSITITDLPFGTYYFVMTTKDTLGNESAFSEMLSNVVN